MKRILIVLGLVWMCSFSDAGPVLEAIPEPADVRGLRGALNLTPQKIAALQAYRDADIDVLFAGLNEDQRQWLKVNREVTWALLKAKVKELQ